MSVVCYFKKCDIFDGTTVNFCTKTDLKEQCGVYISNPLILQEVNGIQKTVINRIKQDVICFSQFGTFKESVCKSINFVDMKQL